MVARTQTSIEIIVNVMRAHKLEYTDHLQKRPYACKCGTTYYSRLGVEEHVAREILGKLEK